MEKSWVFFLFLTLICLFVQGFFSMQEMAAVSFNKVRLQYYVAKKKKRAIWLNRLIQNPARLFGTTLICLSIAMQIGSEASRRFYESLHISPNIAPITQVTLILIFAELSPMFAGRRYAEHVSMGGIGIVYFISILLRPVIYCFDKLCRCVHWLIGSDPDAGMFLTREELQKILEEKVETRKHAARSAEINAVIGNIFTLKTKTAKELMQPLTSVQLIASDKTVDDLRETLKVKYIPFIPVYHRTLENIIGIIYPRDLLREPGYRRIVDHKRAPWFITENTPVIQILKQFKHNNQSLAVVLDREGVAIGILTLDEISDEIFGFSDNWISFEQMTPRAKHVLVERHFSGSMKVDEFNAKYQLDLDGKKGESLVGLITRHLGHAPTKGETIRLGRYELTVEEAPLLGEMIIGIRTTH